MSRITTRNLIYITIGALSVSVLIGVGAILGGSLNGIARRGVEVGLSSAFFAFLASRAATLQTASHSRERRFAQISVGICLLALLTGALALLVHASTTSQGDASALPRLAILFGPVALALALSCEQLARRRTTTDGVVNAIAYTFAGVSTVGALLLSLPVVFAGRFPTVAIYPRALAALLIVALALLVIGALAGRARRSS